MIDEQKAHLLTHVPRLMDALAQSYAAVFSLEELVDIRDFAATSSGRRFMQLSPAIVAEPAFAQANQTLMNESLGIVRRRQDELARRLTEWLERKTSELDADGSVG